MNRYALIFMTILCGTMTRFSAVHANNINVEIEDSIMRSDIKKLRSLLEEYPLTDITDTNTYAKLAETVLEQRQHESNGWLLKNIKQSGYDHLGITFFNCSFIVAFCAWSYGVERVLSYDVKRTLIYDVERVLSYDVERVFNMGCMGMALAALGHLGICAKKAYDTDIIYKNYKNALSIKRLFCDVKRSPRNRSIER